MDDRSPAFRKYAQDWLVGTMHLSLEAQGAYERLLCHQWVDGPLEPDHRRIAKLLGVTARRWARIWAELERHFPVNNDGRLANPRLEHEREKAEGYRIAQSVAGKSGAAARWQGHARADGGRIRPPMAKDGLSGSGSLSQSSHPERSAHRSQPRSAAPVRIGVMLTRGERPTA